MSKIYIPDVTDNNCVVIRSADVIRVYDSRPTLNSEIHYKDYYPALNYQYNEGIQTFGNYSSSLPICREASSNIKFDPNYPHYVATGVLLVGLCVGFIYKILDEVF